MEWVERLVRLLSTTKTASTLVLTGGLSAVAVVRYSGEIREGAAHAGLEAWMPFVLLVAACFGASALITEGAGRILGAMWTRSAQLLDKRNDRLRATVAEDARLSQLRHSCH